MYSQKPNTKRGGTKLCSGRSHVTALKLHVSYLFVEQKCAAFLFIKEI